jgi:type IV pilus assembly protein PilY1
MIATHTQFCSDMTAPPVTDPTDAPSDTALYDNVPAILSGVGLDAQLNQPLTPSLRVRLSKATAPTGLMHEFANSIRFGAMSFNINGSATECSPTSAVKCPKVCSNDSNRSCTTAIDCVPPGTCVDATGNEDGAEIFSYVGAGRCSSTTTTACATKDHCPSGETCVSNGIGTHASGLIAGIDGLKGSTWTPFAEAFYNAIGYFAKTNSGASRTDLRLNATDFNENMNPVEYDCQKNIVMIVSDGMSTADQNASVNSLASAFPGLPTSAASPPSTRPQTRPLPQPKTAMPSPPSWSSTALPTVWPASATQRPS